MIQSFASRDTAAFFGGCYVARYANFESVALRKLQMLDSAVQLKDLNLPPGNRLEQLRGKRGGQHSIRINDQWRLCFRWTKAGPEDVAIVDYH